MEVIPSRKISISIGDRHKHLSPALLIRSCTLNLGMLLIGSQIAHQSRVGVLRSRWFDHRSRAWCKPKQYPTRPQAPTSLFRWPQVRTPRPRKVAAMMMGACQKCLHAAYERNRHPPGKLYQRWIDDCIAQVKNVSCGSRCDDRPEEALLAV
jgi:hypothetical protein